MVTPITHAAQPCDEAFSLLAQNKPQQALTIASDDVRFATNDTEIEVCGIASRLARDRINRAEDEAKQAVEALEKKEYERAGESAGNALQLDGENTSALSVRAELKARPVQTNPVDHEEIWEDSVAAYLVPLGKLSLMAVLVFTALWFLGRLVVLIWPLESPRKRIRASLRTHTRVGVGLAAFAAIGFVWSLSAKAPETGATGALQTLAFAVMMPIGILGAILLGWARANDLRLTVGPSDKKAGDEAFTGRVLALLDEMGGSPPRGLERAYGTDVQGFADALTGLELPSPGGAIARVLQSFATAVVGRTPWRVLVDKSDDGTSVAVLRNRRTAGSLIIRDAQLKLPGVEAPLPVEPFVAAYVLSVLAVHYEGFEGMCGATRWRSIGLQYLASTDYRLEEEESVLLLVAAVDGDPANMLAQVDLASRRWRGSTDAETLNYYFEWLGQQLAAMSHDPTEIWDRARPGYGPLWLRTHLTRSAVAINRHFAPDQPIPAADTLSSAERAVAEMCLAISRFGRFITDTSPWSRLAAQQTWLDQIRTKAAANVMAFDRNRFRWNLFPDHAVPLEHMDILSIRRAPLGVREGHRAWDTLPLSPRTHYSRACALLAPLAPGGSASALPETHEAEGVAHLKQAHVRTDLAEWMPKDPQLARFWAEKGHEIFPREPLDFFDLTLITPHAVQLKRSGLTTASSIATFDHQMLGSFVAADEHTRRKIVATAELVTSLAVTELRAVACDAVAVLITLDHASKDSLAKLSDGAREMVTQALVKDLLQVAGAPPAAQLTDAVSEWLDELHVP